MKYNEAAFCLVCLLSDSMVRIRVAKCFLYTLYFSLLKLCVDVGNLQQEQRCKVSVSFRFLNGLEEKGRGLTEAAPSVQGTLASK